MRFPVRLVTGTDGASKQCRALLTFVHSLAVAGTRSLDSVDVLCPPGWEAHVRARLGPAAALCRIFAPNCELPPGDPYALKFLLASPDWLAMNDDGPMLYLDYDHLTYRMPRLSTVEDGIIWISSQQDALADLDVAKWPPSLHRDLVGVHPNTSLIYSTVRTMSACAQEWRRCYRELMHVVGHRWREEIAFGWAARRVGVELRHVDINVQASWQSATADCALFHYGGETEAASVIKEHVLQVNTLDELNTALLKAERLEPVARRRVLDAADTLADALAIRSERSQ